MVVAKKFGRKRAHRDHMLRNLAASVILYESLETTEAKAKEVRKLVDKSIILAKKNTLHTRRNLESLYFDRNVVTKLFEVLRLRYVDRPSGFTRILRVGNRHGDNASKTLITLIPEVKPTTKESPEEQEKTKKAKDAKTK